MSAYRPLDVNSLEYNNNMDYANTTNDNPFAASSAPAYVSSVPNLTATPPQLQPMPAAAPAPAPSSAPVEKYSIFSKRYYQTFFDVSTEVVLTRIRRALIPIGPLFFEAGAMFSFPIRASDSVEAVSRLEEGQSVEMMPEPTINQGSSSNTASPTNAPTGTISPVAIGAQPAAKRPLEDYAPDVYGPFWVTTTLIFVLGVVGNFIDYLKHRGNVSSWHYDFEKITFAATLFYLLITVCPVVVWFILRKFNVPYTLSAIMCLYGYSLSIYIPIAILCAIRVPYLSLVAISVAGFISTFFLCRNIFAKFLAAAPANVDVNGTVNANPSTDVLADAELDPATEHKKAGLMIVGGVGMIHAGVAIACYFYFLSF